MPEEFIADEDDRRDLLAFYSSSQLQYVGLTVAMAAAVLAELGVWSQLDLFYPARLIFFAGILPSGFLMISFFQASKVWTISVRKLLAYPVPTTTTLDAILKETGPYFLPPRETNESRGFDNLDYYYSALAQKECQKHWLARRLMKGGRRTYLILVILLGVGFAIGLASGI